VEKGHWEVQDQAPGSLGKKGFWAFYRTLGIQAKMKPAIFSEDLKAWGWGSFGADELCRWPSGGKRGLLLNLSVAKGSGKGYL